MQLQKALQFALARQHPISFWDQMLKQTQIQIDRTEKRLAAARDPDSAEAIRQTLHVARDLKEHYLRMKEGRKSAEASTQAAGDQ